MHIFTIIGMEVFGGKISPNSAELAATDFGQSNYYSMSYADVLVSSSIWLVKVYSALGSTITAAAW